MARSYLEHSHRSAAFESSADNADTGYHSGSHTPCTVSLTLACSSHVGRTLSSVPSRHVRGSRLGIVSGPTGTDFGGENTEAAPLPALDGISRFGSISAAAHWQGLDAPFIVELFTVCFFGRSPEVVTSGWSVLRPPGSRRQRALREPHELCTRLAIMALVTRPAGGFGSFLPHPL